MSQDSHGAEGVRIPNILFSGPTGTGKGLLARRAAVGLVDGSTADDPHDLAERYRQLVEAGRILPCVLHDTFTYDVWLESRAEGSTLEGGRVRPGVLRQAVEACGSDSQGMARLFRPGEVIVSSTGSTYTVSRVDEPRITLLRHDRRKNLRSVEDDVHFADVGDCVDGGVLPRELSYSGADADNRAKRADVAKRLGWSTTKLTNSAGLRAVYEAVLERQRRKQGPAAVVLLVQHLHRVSPLALWGEALELLPEARRRGGPEEDVVLLPHSRELFALPANLHVIATAATDASGWAAARDAYQQAFDLRWVGPDAEQVSPVAQVDLPGLFSRANELIRRQSGAEFELGHAPLTRAALAARASRQGWKGADAKVRAVAHVLRTWMLPAIASRLPLEGRAWRAEFGAWGEALQQMLDPACPWLDPLDPRWDGARAASALQRMD